MQSLTEVLAAHAARYPLMTPQDAYKLLHQSFFAGGHMIPSPAASLAYLKEESAQAEGDFGFEAIAGGFVRLHIGREMPLLPETVNGLFVDAANRTRGDREAFHAALPAMDFLFHPGAGEAEWRKYGGEACHHSEAFRDAYHPAYRVVDGQAAFYFPLFATIDKALKAGKDRLLVAIDGMCASGKSTLGAYLSRVYGANLFHMDDFFLTPEQRTEARLAQPGGNVNAERFLKEVLEPLARGEAFSYRPYRCHPVAELLPPVYVTPTRVSIVEGAYSLHPLLRDNYDIRCLVTIGEETQKARILARDGEAFWPRFQQQWIPLELRYLEACGVRAICAPCFHIE